MRLVDKLLKRNEDIFNQPAAVLAFLGDSVTHGCFEIFRGHRAQVETVTDYDAVYHARFRRLLCEAYPDAPIQVINAGISGDSAAGGLKRLGRDALLFKPDLLVVCFGLNDCHRGDEGLLDYRDSLRGIFRAAKENGAEPLLMTPNMMNTYVRETLTDPLFIQIAKDSQRIQNGGMLDKYVGAALQVCLDEDVPVCDCYAKWKALSARGVDTTRLLSNDINHPTRSMHELFARALFDRIMFS